jgi:CRP-like cAMP-binding protein
MYEALFNHLARFVSINESEREMLTSTLRCKKVAKKEYLLKQGQICSGNFFVLSGCVRLYSITATGTELKAAIIN